MRTLRTAVAAGAAIGAALCAGPAAMAGDLAFSDGFETYPPGALGGTGGWKGSGEVVSAPDARLGEQSLGLIGPGATMSRQLPGFYGTVRLDLLAGATTREDEHVDIEAGSAGRLDARVRFDSGGGVRVLQPSADGPVWVDAGTWDAGDIATVELTVRGGGAMTLAVDGEMVYSGLTLDAMQVSESVPLEHFGVRKSGDGAGYIDNLEIERSTCSGDFQGDGVVDVLDLALLLSVWNNPSLTYPDINQSGRIGAGDLGLLLSQWGACGG